MTRLIRIGAAAGFLLMSSIGCLATTEPPKPDAGATESTIDAGPTIDGEMIYRTPQSARSKFACVHCHALEEPAEDGLRRPGHSLGDATQRPTFKNGSLSSILEATNTCLTEWMLSETAWSDDTEAWIALRTFLELRAPDGPAPALDFQIVAPPADVSGGDLDRGRASFNGSCAVCHGIDAAGTALAPAIKNTGIDGAYVARRVRTGGPVNSPTYAGLTGGTMPFWSLDRLSDAELRDIVAYVIAP